MEWSLLLYTPKTLKRECCQQTNQPENRNMQRCTCVLYRLCNMSKGCSTISSGDFLEDNWYNHVLMDCSDSSLCAVIILRAPIALPPVFLLDSPFLKINLWWFPYLKDTLKMMIKIFIFLPSCPSEEEAEEAEVTSCVQDIYCFRAQSVAAEL